MAYLKRHWHMILIAYAVIGLVYAYERGNGSTAGVSAAITNNIKSVFVWPLQIVGIMS